MLTRRAPVVPGRLFTQHTYGSRIHKLAVLDIGTHCLIVNAGHDESHLNELNREKYSHKRVKLLKIQKKCTMKDTQKENNEKKKSTIANYK